MLFTAASLLHKPEMLAYNEWFNIYFMYQPSFTAIAPTPNIEVMSRGITVPRLYTTWQSFYPETNKTCVFATETTIGIGIMRVGEVPKTPKEWPLSDKNMPYLYINGIKSKLYYATIILQKTTQISTEIKRRSPLLWLYLNPSLNENPGYSLEEKTIHSIKTSYTVSYAGPVSYSADLL